MMNFKEWQREKAEERKAPSSAFYAYILYVEKWRNSFFC
jgi:hypothetical protein